MTYKDAVKYGVVCAITMYTIDVSIRVTTNIIERYRFTNDREYREKMRKHNHIRYLRLKTKYDS